LQEKAVKISPQKPGHREGLYIRVCLPYRELPAGLASWYEDAEES